MLWMQDSDSQVSGLVLQWCVQKQQKGLLTSLFSILCSSSCPFPPHDLATYTPSAVLCVGCGECLALG